MEENVVEAITNNVLGTGNLVEAAAGCVQTFVLISTDKAVRPTSAVQLVSQAGALGAGGELFVLDKGELVKIMDLARDLIRLSGMEEGVDVDIAFSGVRKLRSA